MTDNILANELMEIKEELKGLHEKLSLIELSIEKRLSPLEVEVKELQDVRHKAMEARTTVLNRGMLGLIFIFIGFILEHFLRL